MTKQLYNNPDIDLKLSLISKPEVMMTRENSLRRHEEESLRGTVSVSVSVFTFLNPKEGGINLIFFSS